jgi:hypothetical protein
MKLTHSRAADLLLSTRVEHQYYESQPVVATHSLICSDLNVVWNSMLGLTAQSTVEPWSMAWVESR